MEREKLGYQSPTLDVMVLCSADVITASQYAATFITRGTSERWINFGSSENWGGGN